MVQDFWTISSMIYLFVTSLKNDENRKNVATGWVDFPSHISFTLHSLTSNLRVFLMVEHWILRWFKMVRQEALYFVRIPFKQTSIGLAAKLFVFCYFEQHESFLTWFCIGLFGLVVNFFRIPKANTGNTQEANAFQRGEESLHFTSSKG